MKNMVIKMEFENIRYIMLIPMFLLLLVSIEFLSDVIPLLFVLSIIVSSVILIYQIITKTKDIFKSD